MENVLNCQYILRILWSKTVGPFIFQWIIIFINNNNYNNSVVFVYQTGCIGNFFIQTIRFKSSIFCPNHYENSLYFSPFSFNKSYILLVGNIGFNLLHYKHLNFEFKKGMVLHDTNISDWLNLEIVIHFKLLSVNDEVIISGGRISPLPYNSIFSCIKSGTARQNLIDVEVYIPVNIETFNNIFTFNTEKIIEMQKYVQSKRCYKKPHGKRKSIPPYNLWIISSSAYER